MLPASEGWERLHPLSPLLKAGRVGWFLVLIAVQNMADGTGIPLALVTGVVAVVVLVAGAVAYVAWRVTGFRVVGTDLEVHTGLLFRQHRNVPLARLESVDIRRPFLARMFGLAEVRVEVVSQGDSEVSLQFLTDGHATVVRDRLAMLARGVSIEAASSDTDADVAPTAAEADEPVRAILQVPAKEILLGYGAPFLLLATVLLLMFVVATILTEPAAAAATVGAFLITAVGGLLPLAASIDRMLNFKLGETDDALHVERGLLNQLTQRVSVGRIQAIRIEQPWLWRPFGRGKLTVDVAGYRGGQRQQGAETALLLPIGPMAVIAYLLARLPEGVTTEGLDFVGLPRQARWRSPLRWRRYSVAYTDAHAVTRSGLLRLRTDIVPHAKVQSLRVTDGPWQRALGLASLHFDTAGTRIKATAHHRATADAIALADRSRDLDRAARVASMPPTELDVGRR